MQTGGPLRHCLHLLNIIGVLRCQQVIKIVLAYRVTCSHVDALHMACLARLLGGIAFVSQH